MSYIPEDYVEKVYAGWLGKIIGVRHGSNIEGWSYEEIYKKYGEISDYLFEFKNFAADDDTNGPIFFLRALEDYKCYSELKPEQVGLTWLNYAPFEHGFFWWGGYGKSTEHTAYLNLRSGIMAPRSGSIKQNGKAVAEQIGGQIFIDTWGLAVPCNYGLAADYARNAASVSHDGNGIYGSMFIAACISAAFNMKDIGSIINAGLSVIPKDCEYSIMASDIISYFNNNPNSWRDCYQFIKGNYGYDKYPGSCHIIPNAAIILLSLLYGDGDFSKSINVCNMCGWDTDCNAANVGAIVGVMVGLDGIEMKWRNPINDLLICSSVIGSLNIMDIPDSAFYIAKIGYKIAGAQMGNKWKDIIVGKAAKFHFELPGSTHAFRLKADEKEKVKLWLNQTTEVAHTGEGSLRVNADIKCNTEENVKIKAFIKTYYRPSDFNDSRYDPAFSPILYPGQRLQAYVMSDNDVSACLYILDGNSNTQFSSELTQLRKGEWVSLSYVIPPMCGACIEEAGVEFLSPSGTLIAYIDDFDIKGEPSYTLDFSKERIEVWNFMHREISQMTILKGLWDLENGELSGSCNDFGEAYSGLYDMKNYTMKVVLAPVLGEYHNINFRVQGAIRSYALGLSSGNKLVLYKNNNGYKELTSMDYDWELGMEYEFIISVVHEKIQISDNNKSLIKYEDKDSPYLSGQFGFSVWLGSHCHYKSLEINALS